MLKFEVDGGKQGFDVWINLNMGSPQSKRQLEEYCALKHVRTRTEHWKQVSPNDHHGRKKVWFQDR